VKKIRSASRRFAQSMQTLLLPPRRRTGEFKSFIPLARQPQLPLPHHHAHTTLRNAIDLPLTAARQKTTATGVMESSESVLSSRLRFLLLSVSIAATDSLRPQAVGSAVCLSATAIVQHARYGSKDILRHFH